jgi:deoxyribodipyrimidine photo-lyase
MEWQAIACAPDDEARRSASAWLDELIWREFFIALLFHFPHLPERPLRPEGDRRRWRHDPEGFLAWVEGRTGYPLVDAAMRQLRATGWMPNRARMVVASFLTRLLGIDWRWGARVFFAELLDGDPAVNLGNWQWVAGVGTDYASSFRRFDPTRQARKWDPEGRYIRRWVPELERVPAPYVHAPWTMPPEIQRASRCRIGVDYPAPLGGWVEESRPVVPPNGGGDHREFTG